MSEFESSREFVLWIMYQNRSQQSWMCEDNWQMKRILIFHQVFGLNECICEYPHVARPRQEKAAFTWDIYSITKAVLQAVYSKKTKQNKKNLSVSSLLAEKHLIIMLNFIQMGSAGSEQLFVVSFLAA